MARNAALRQVLSDGYDQANQLIASHQASGNDAARVLFEVMMLADVVGDRAIGGEIRIRLFLDHPTTLQANFVIGLFSNEAAYRQLLLQAWKKEPRELTDEFCGKFQAALRLGGERWNSALFADDDFLLVSALSAYRTGDVQLLDLVRQKLSQSGKKPGEIAAIAMGELAPREKFLRLVPHCDRIAVPDFCDLFYSQLSVEDRDAAKVASGRVRQLIAAHRYEAALPVVQKLVADEPTPSHLLWQAWVQSLTHNTDDALRTLDLIDGSSESQEFAEDCRQLRTAAAALRDNTDTHLQAIKKSLALMAWNGELQAIEMNVKSGDNLEDESYLGIDFGKEAFGVTVVKSGKPSFLCRLEKGTARFFVRNDERVIAYRELESFPLMKATLERAADGSFAFTYNFSVTSSPKETSTALQSLLQSPWLGTDKGLRDLLEYWIRQGWLPLPILDEPSGRRLRWVSLDRDLKGNQSCELHLSRDDRLTEFKSETLEVTSLRYGRSGSFELGLPSLPDLPVEWREKFDGASVFQVLAWVSTMFQDETKQVAARRK